MKPDARRLISVDRAIQRYTISLRQGLSPCRSDGDSAGQTENYRDALERAELRYSQVKEILCSAGVPTTQLVFYRNFGLHLDKLFRDHSEQSLRLHVRDAIARWTCYGCNPEVLRAICEQVFRLTLS